MKKIIAVILGAFFCLAGLSAEHLKFKVAGDAIHYNQIRIVNKTDYKNFKCEVFLLEEVDGKTYVKEALGKYHLGGFGDQDTCTFVTNVVRGACVGIELPDDLKEVTYSAVYDEGFIIDTIEFTLIKGSAPVANDGSQLGREF